MAPMGPVTHHPDKSAPTRTSTHPPSQPAGSSRITTTQRPPNQKPASTADGDGRARPCGSTVRLPTPPPPPRAQAGTLPRPELVVVVVRPWRRSLKSAIGKTSGSRCSLEWWAGSPGVGSWPNGMTTATRRACSTPAPRERSTTGRRRSRAALVLDTTAGQAGDTPAFETVMPRIRAPRTGPSRPRTRPVMVLADQAYSSRAIRGHLCRRQIHAVIPQPSDQIAHRLRRGRQASTRMPTSSATR